MNFEKGLAKAGRGGAPGARAGGRVRALRVLDAGGGAWRSTRSAAASIFGRLSLRAAAVACLLAVVAVAVNYSAITGAFDDERAVAAGDDPVAEVVDMGS
jgi:hypothetical protein